MHVTLLLPLLPLLLLLLLGEPAGGQRQEARDVPEGVARPKGSPGGREDDKLASLRIGDWTAQWSTGQYAWYAGLEKNIMKQVFQQDVLKLVLKCRI